ncbi:3-oxoacyl-[acyl-carrier-protein] synthase III C-terminal domain-containing protein [Streptomyces sp. NPDC005805]|uniref:3-oxoacyl-[acyl-carrier-protein] synthase III C-terminal domain-containing protein n=1 Tax=Streptomyces sp. NPDC005805 TaxID=3157068 RepID=UPI0033F38F00
MKAGHSSSRREAVRLIGGSFALPPAAPPRTVRTLDGASAAGHQQADLFTGEAGRRVLGPGQSIEDLVVDAGRRVLDGAGLDAGRVDRLYGYVSLGEFLFPNGLFVVHRNLGLSSRCLTVPVNGEFANLLLGIMHAWEGVTIGRSEHALVAVGSRMSHSVDPGHPLADYISDAATAFLVGRSTTGLEIVDTGTEVLSDEFGAMTMAWDPAAGRPAFRISDDSGRRAYLTTGMDGPVRLVRDLLRRHSVRPRDVTLITHQSSRLLLDHWAARIRPYRHIDTFTEYGNMAHASVGVTLAKHWEDLDTQYVALVGLGLGAQNIAVLLRAS